MLSALDLHMSSHLRFIALMMALCCPANALAQDAPSPAVDPPQVFEAWLTDFVAEARSKGFSDDLLSKTVTSVTPLPMVVTADRTQAELTVGFARYLATRVTPPVIRRGRTLARQERSVLRGIERRFNVQRRFLLAVWGLESRYGRVTGRTPVFQALATLAWEPRRAPFFRGQLYDALTIVANGYIDAASMTGSWAGAMGYPQFMPSSYLQYAVDQDGDGRRDIWHSSADALASIANYLKGSGWNGDETWGREVRVTPAIREKIAAAVPRRTEGCYAMRNMTERVPLPEWQRLGVRLTNGGALPRAQVAAGLVETDDRSFLVYTNYDAILRYNCAHYYALSVALLADRLQ
ncbi:MAG: lytic murein transglycosylase [Acidobacteria bacterium]|nr:lytic murein transglycosylase [Acidobacteriota bacterium]